MDINLNLNSSESAASTAVEMESTNNVPVTVIEIKEDSTGKYVKNDITLEWDRLETAL